MAKLEVQIGADSGDFMSEIAKVEKQLADLKKQQATNIKLGIDTSSINKQISDTTTKLDHLKGSVNSSSTAFNNHSKATANGGNTLMQFSRIAQDAPFGIIGIGNNLTATAEAFGSLSKSSGGAGAALKAVGASLMGPGGILLAISLVTTGLTVMAQKGLTISDVFNMLSGNFSQAAQDIKKAYEESSKSALGEVASIKAVIAVAKDETASRRDRLAAVNELQSKYPAYFGNLTEEQIKYGDLSKEIDSVSKALIAKALAEKISEKAGDAQFKILQLNAQLIKDKETLIKAEKTLQNAAKSGSSAQAMATYSNELNRAKNNLQETRKEWIAANKEAEKYQSTLDKVTKTNVSTKASEDQLKANKKLAAETAKIKPPKPEPFKNPNPNFKGGNGFIGGGIVNPNSGIVAPDLGVDEAAIIAAEKTRAGLLLQEKVLEDFNSNANSIINGSIASTFVGLGTNIGEALASGGNVLKAAGGALLAGLGSVLVELGKMAIQTGVGILAVKKSLKTLNPYVAIAAGVGLVALGSAFSSKSKSLGGSMGGGGSDGGGGQRGSISSGADVSSPTSSVSSGGSFSNSGGTVVFEIAGQKLIGVLNNTTQGNLRLGGSGLVG